MDDNAVLNARQYRFVQEYCVDFNATKAYVRAGYSEVGASAGASRLLADVKVQEAIEEQKDALAAMTHTSVAVVVRELLARATADPRKLLQTRIGACRCCYGIDHKYQWTQGEYEAALDRALRDDAPAPAFLGGFGFNGTIAPFPGCPECHGEGVARVWIADSRDLDRATARLISSVKQTKDGIELRIADQMPAITKLGEYLAMFKTKAELSGPGGGPIPLATVNVNELSDEQLAALCGGRTEINGGNIEGTLMLTASNTTDMNQLEAASSP